MPSHDSWRYGALRILDYGNTVACGLCDGIIALTDDSRVPNAKLLLHESSFTGDRTSLILEHLEDYSTDVVSRIEEHIRDFHRTELRGDIHP